MIIFFQSVILFLVVEKSASRYGSKTSYKSVLITSTCWGFGAGGKPNKYAGSNAHCEVVLITNGASLGGRYPWKQGYDFGPPVLSTKSTNFGFWDARSATRFSISCAAVLLTSCVS